MNHYSDTRSSEKQRITEQDARNHQRREAWIDRFILAKGRPPKPLNQIIAETERHGNGTVLKFPRHKHQYIGASLPGPDAA